MTDLNRRSFLKTKRCRVAGAAVAGGPFAGFLAGPAVAGTAQNSEIVLLDVPDLRDGVVRLALPEGFRYRSFQPSQRGVPTQLTLDDGSLLPGRHDGMAAFPGPGRGLVTLIRNHEENGSAAEGAFHAPEGSPSTTPRRLAARRRST